MKLFQNLFKPKWKNSDPAIRKQAILSLEPKEHQTTLIEVVNHDPSSDLRLLALKRISDFDFITHSSQSNSNEKVKTLANKLVRQALSGEQTSPLDEQQRIEKIQRINEQKLFEYIVENGNTVTLRKSAIEHISREALLGNLAISDADSDIRHTAAEKISQKSTLERVYRATKTKDKNVSRIIKARLDHLIAEAEKPAKLLAAQKEICSAIENLGSKGLWQRDKLQFDTYIQQWLALEEPNSLALKKRLEQASVKFTQNYETYLKRHEERLKQEASYLPIREEKQALIEQLKSLAEQLEKISGSDETALSGIQQSIKEKETIWQTIKTLPEDIEEEIFLQFNDALKTIKQEIKQRFHSKTLFEKLEKLQKETHYHLKHPFKLSEGIIHQFSQKWSELNTHSANENIIQLKQKIKQNIDQASEQLTKQNTRMASLLDNVKIQLDEMEIQLGRGVLKEAIGIRNTIQKSLIELDKHGIKNLHALKERLNQSSQQINELSNWRSWANTPQKEQLIHKVEVLIDSGLDPKEIAYIVSQARKDWKKLGPSEKNSSQKLWEKFQTTCDKAYEPCKVFFAEEAKVQEKNTDERVAFLETLENFLNQVDWESVDWKKIETLFRQTRQDWNELGLTDKKIRKELNKRFYSSHDQLKTALNQEWDKNSAKKSAIVSEATALANVEDLQTAINEAKALQQRWKKAGRIQHVKERALWGDFKQACDAVFARRDDLNKQKDEEIQHTIDSKNGLIEKIETCCNQPLDTFEKAKTTLQQLKIDLNNLGHTTPEADTKFDKRLTSALELYERKQESLEKYHIVIDLLRLKEKAELCNKLEHAIETNDACHIEDLVAEIEKTQPTKHPEWNSRIIQRFQKSLQFSQAENSKSLLANDAKNNLELKSRTIVQLEIIADIETPENAIDERMKVQTQRLSDKLQNHAEEDKWTSFLATEVNWLTTGPILNDDLFPLITRHNNVVDALKLEYPEELKNY